MKPFVEGITLQEECDQLQILALFTPGLGVSRK
jgi:hypothetical protein